MSPFVHAERIRMRDIRSLISTAVSRGHDFFVLLAIERRPDGTEPGDNPPYVQFAWRDDLRLQIETQGDHYRDEPYTEHQRRVLHDLGYLPPFELGDEFGNWTIMREAEGCQPESVATLMTDTLWLVHATNFLDTATARRCGVSFWDYESSISSTKRDINAEILRRYGNPRDRVS